MIARIVCGFSILVSVSIAQTTQPTAEDFRAANQAVQGEGVVFPVEANVRNVKAFGAKGDGVTDDTEAIRAAYQGSGMLYFPNGTYLISDQIKAPRKRGGAASRRIIQGQSREGVIIKLADNAPGFENASEPKSVLITSWGVAQGFRNAVRDVTIEIGQGNPGAVGLEFFASNQGQVENVAVRAPHGGHAGVLLEGDNGPMLLKNIQVDGFDTGVIAAANQSSTFETLTVRGQSKVGVAVGNKTFIHNLVSENNCPAITTRGQALVLRSARLSGGTDGPAIIVGSMAKLRDVVVEGYPVAIQQGDTTVTERQIAEWTSSAPLPVTPTAPSKSLGLEVKATPEVEWDAPQKWVSVTSFEPAELVVERKGKRVKHNWAAALQKAIDSGATTVYFPPGRSYEMTGEVVVRGNVRRIIGMEADFRQLDTLPGVEFILEDGASPVVSIERFDSMYADFNFRSRANRTLVIQHLMCHEIVLEKGAGDLFTEDIVTAFIDINGQHVWSRQLNAEHSYNPTKEPTPRPNVRNVGGTFWLFGLKTEQNRPKVHTTAGGKAEIAAYILANRNNNQDPMFINEGGQTSVSVVENVLRKRPFPVVLRDISGSQTSDLTHESSPRRGEGVAVPLTTAGQATE